MDRRAVIGGLYLQRLVFKSEGFVVGRQLR
jgi:hypothetical protein